MGQKGVWHSLPLGIRRLAIGLVVAQVALVVAHLLAFELTASAIDPKSARHPFDFNQEGTLPTWWSAVVMAGAGLAAIIAGVNRPSRASRLGWLALGCGFIWIGLEEGVLHLHEDTQIASGIDWPVIYLPALVIGSLLIVRVARELQGLSRSLLLAGLGLMVAAVGAELLSSPQIALDYDQRNLVEENLELAGAGLMLLAALISRSEPGSSPEPHPSPAVRGAGFAARPLRASESAAASRDG